MKKITLILFLLSFFFNVNAQSTAGCGDSIDITYESSFNGLLYSFSAPSGQYASVTVGGEAENNYDYMWITDGSGNDLYGSSASPITGVLSGTYESTDGTILIYLTSDSSVTRTMTFEFNCYDPPSCIAPTALSATVTSSTEATVSWTAGDSETAWEYVVQAAGTGEPTGAGTATTTNPLSLSGLTAITAYEIYLRADCGGDLSPWVNTDFTTPCDTFTAPYSQDFENAGAIPDCWSMSGSEPWLFTNSAAASHIGNAGTIGNTTASGGYFAYVDDSSPDSTGTTLESPLIDISSLTTPVLSFYLLSNNEGNSNVSFSVDVYDGAAWNTGFYTSNSNTADWEEVTVNLSSLTITGPIQVRFVVDERPTGDFYDDVAIDDVKIMELPSCAKPTDLSISNITSISASLTWTAGDSETAWEYVVQASGTGEPTGAGTATTTNPLSLSGLISNTDYEIYLRADCGGELSEWVRTTFITTAGCGDSVSITYENSFNGLVYSFSAPSGQYASVTVGGETESCCDDMWITDGSGNALYGSQASPIAGILSGTYESTDGTILIYLDSDSSVNRTMTFEFNCYDPPVSSPDCATNFTNTVDSSCGNVDFSVSWDNVVGAGGYFITAGTTSGGNDLADAEDLGTSTTYNFTAIIGQSYYYTVTPYNLNGNAEGCEEQSVTTASEGCYCVSSPTNVDGNGLSTLSLQGTEFGSVGTTNEDFTATPVDVSQSTTASLEVTWDTGYTYYTNVWVDFNDDYNFDSTELVATGASSTVLDLSFAVPLTATLGEHRLRIVGNYSSFSSGDPCYSGSWATSIDMTINVTEPPACLPPSGLTHSSSATDATVSWTAGGSETAWEYVVQLLGGGEPSGTGTATTTNPISLSGLASNTAYEFWLRADCGGDFSPWVNTSFVTSVGCGDSIDILYENSFNGLLYSFSAPLGQYASVTVGGEAENNYDYMWITDGSGNDLYGSSASPVTGVLSGTYESTDGTILIYLTSDSSVNRTMTFAFGCETADLVDPLTLQFTYFPNPVNDQLTINAQTKIDNIVVLNMLGQVVSSQSPNSLNCLVDMAAMRTGVYFVQVSIGNNNQTVRVLKQ